MSANNYSRAMPTLSEVVMGDNNYYYGARASDVNLESITSSEYNALILEKLRDNYDEFDMMGIVGVSILTHVALKRTTSL